MDESQRKLIRFIIAVTLIVPPVMHFAGHYRSMYRWMTYIPLAIAVPRLLEREPMRAPSFARRIALAAQHSSFARLIIVDLSRVRDASTDAFADLILLRRYLLRRGRDLRIDGLRDRAAKVYEVNRLGDVLPLR